MSVTTTTHLNFRGAAREALDFYQSVFGGRVVAVTYKDVGSVQNENEADWVMWGEVAGDNGFRVMAYDAFPAALEPGREPLLRLRARRRRRRDQRPVAQTVARLHGGASLGGRAMGAAVRHAQRPLRRDLGPGRHRPLQRLTRPGRCDGEHAAAPASRARHENHRGPLPGRGGPVERSEGSGSPCECNSWDVLGPMRTWACRRRVPAVSPRPRPLKTELGAAKETEARALPSAVSFGWVWQTSTTNGWLLDTFRHAAWGVVFRGGRRSCVSDHCFWQPQMVRDPGVKPRWCVSPGLHPRRPGPGAVRARTEQHAAPQDHVRVRRRLLGFGLLSAFRHDRRLARGRVVASVSRSRKSRSSRLRPARCRSPGRRRRWQWCW